MNTKRILNAIISAVIIANALFFYITPRVVDIGNSREIVYTTTYGSKYHCAGCGSLWKSAHACKLVGVSGDPCDRCHPPKPNFPWYWELGFFSWLMIGYFIYCIFYAVFFTLSESARDKELKSIYDTQLYSTQLLYYRNKNTGKIEHVEVIRSYGNEFVIAYQGKEHTFDRRVLGKRLFLNAKQVKKYKPIQ